MKKATIVVSLGIVLGLGINLAFAKKPTQKPAGTEKKGTQTIEAQGIEPKLIWKKTFEYPIDSFSVSNDGSLILVNIVKYEDNKVKVVNYLFNKEGKIIQEERNDGVLINEETGEINWKDKEKGDIRGKVILGDGKRILTSEGIKDIEGKSLGKIKLEDPQTEWPIYSPNRNYIAVIPGYEANFPFLKVYEATTGKLLWKYQKGQPGEIIPIFLTASFCSDDELAVYTEGKVILYDTKTGKEKWERVLMEKPKDNGYESLATSKNGAIVLNYSGNNTIYSINSSGILQWKYEKSVVGECIKLSGDGKFLVGRFPENLLFFDNNSGKILWQKKIKFGYYSENIEFSSDGKYLFITTFLSGDKERYEKSIDNRNGKVYLIPKANLYILDTKGNVRWKREMESTMGSVDLQFLIKDGRLILKDKKDLYLFDISSFAK